MRKFFIPAFLFLALTVLYTSRLSFPEKEYYDEVYHVKTAREFLALKGNTDTAHPPLGKLLIALSIRTFGDFPWAWRLVPCLAGLGAILVFQRLARRVFESDSFGWLAAMLFALDGISFTQARIAMLNAAMMFFMLLTVLFFIKILESSGREKKYFFLCGVFLGLGVATRWVSLAVLPVLGMIFLGQFRRVESWADFLFKALLFLVILPMAIYFSSHIILFWSQGYKGWDILKYQVQMFRYHASLHATHHYGSPWWSWPLLKRPIWYFFERRAGLVYGILCIGNPAVIWALAPAAIYLVWQLFSPRGRVCAFILMGFLSQWLPWAFVSRVKFFHYFYTAMPFLALAITFALKDLWQSGKPGRIAGAFYIVLVLGLFAYWYPLLAGCPISEAYFENHLWFKSWI